MTDGVSGSAIKYAYGSASKHMKGISINMPFGVNECMKSDFIIT